MPFAQVVNHPIYLNGARHEPGKVFPISAEQLERLQRVECGCHKAATVVEVDGPEAVEEVEVTLEWTVKMTPFEYLERYPNGPNAKLAHAVIDAGLFTEDDDETEDNDNEEEEEE